MKKFRVEYLNFNSQLLKYDIVKGDNKTAVQELAASQTIVNELGQTVVNGMPDDTHFIKVYEISDSGEIVTFIN